MMLFYFVMLLLLVLFFFVEMRQKRFLKVNGVDAGGPQLLIPTIIYTYKAKLIRRSLLRYILPSALILLVGFLLTSYYFFIGRSEWLNRLLETQKAKVGDTGFDEYDWIFSIAVTICFALMAILQYRHVCRLRKKGIVLRWELFFRGLLTPEIRAWQQMDKDEKSDSVRHYYFPETLLLVAIIVFVTILSVRAHGLFKLPLFDIFRSFYPTSSVKPQ